ncbi:hypothetical protein CYMTET_49944 [Cymbomonas tetramitiformis]|uniref:Uncharacterized protein n=1 Tax=Cymbomonas tetramitiformis TaxID=36881 RepID=A0AAE0BP51_9CHLO|nr:hypothetical protein CYMTET_49944 [Cymbomonas tetramitiformis]
MNEDPKDSFRAGPLLTFPIAEVPAGVKTFAHNMELQEAFESHPRYDLGAQILFLGWIQSELKVAGVVRDSGLRLLLLNSLGRLLIMKEKPCFGGKSIYQITSSELHIGHLRKLASSKPGSLSAEFEADTHSDVADLKVITKPEAADCLIQGLRMLVAVANVGAPLHISPDLGPTFNLPVHLSSPLSLPPPPADGGFHTAFLIWHSCLSPCRMYSGFLKNDGTLAHKDYIQEELENLPLGEQHSYAKDFNEGSGRFTKIDGRIGRIC